MRNRREKHLDLANAIKCVSEIRFYDNKTYAVLDQEGKDMIKAALEFQVQSDFELTLIMFHRLNIENTVYHDYGKTEKGEFHHAIELKNRAIIYFTEDGTYLDQRGF